MRLENTEQLCLMALSVDTKFEGKLTCASKNYMRNLAIFFFYQNIHCNLQTKKYIKVINSK